MRRWREGRQQKSAYRRYRRAPARGGSQISHRAKLRLELSSPPSSRCRGRSGGKHGILRKLNLSFAQHTKEQHSLHRHVRFLTRLSHAERARLGVCGLGLHNCNCSCARAVRYAPYVATCHPHACKHMDMHENLHVHIYACVHVCKPACMNLSMNTYGHT